MPVEKFARAWWVFLLPLSFWPSSLKREEGQKRFKDIKEQPTLLFKSPNGCLAIQKGMHTMGRRDPRFNAFDVIRLFETNLGINDKRLVVAWFFTQIPVKEPKVDVLQLILDLVALVPVAGTAGAIFSISVSTAQAVKDIADILGFEFEEEDVELARLKFELESAEEAFRMTRQELLRCQIDLDQANEQADALRATIALLEEEAAMPRPDGTPIMIDLETFISRLERIRASATNIRNLSGPRQGPTDWVNIDNSAIVIENIILELVELIDGRT